MKYFFVFILLIFILISCAEKEATAVTDGVNIDSLFSAYTEFKNRINPLEATKGGENAYNAQLPNYISEPFRRESIQSYEGFLGDIARVDTNAVTPSQLISLKAMRWDCEIKREGLLNPVVTVASPLFDLPHFKDMPVIQISGFQLYFSQLGGGESIQPFQTVEDYDNWLQRVYGYVAWVDTAISNMQRGTDKGILWPKVITQRVIRQMEDLTTDGPIEAHLFYQPIRRMPADFPETDQKRLAEAYSNMIKTKLDPANRRLLDFLKKHYLTAGTNFTGIGELPNGPETYQYLIKYHTSTNMTPSEVFELGKQEVDRIWQEMEKVRQQVGYEGDLKSFLVHVRNKKELMPYTQPEQVLAHYNRIHEKMMPQLDRLFSLKPKAGFEVRRTEAFREAAASAEYLPGSKDGSRPGVFYVPIPDVLSYNIFNSEALFLHEAIPGHHYQLSLQQENEQLPGFLHAEGMGVFVEGWALYAESLGAELGLYEDPYQYFGMLSAEMHRAIRLVVDAGMHAMGWTREQAIQYSLEHEADSEAGITAEIERYMSNPGQALSYKVGQLKIRSLRQKAEQALGTRFDIREFHRQVLDSGSLPLVLLEEKIDAWINGYLK